MLFKLVVPTIILLILNILKNVELQSEEHSSSSNDPNLMTRERFAEVVRFFVSKGWMWDYGGGMAIRVNQTNSKGGKEEELVYVTANKYVKSSYDPADIYIYDYSTVMEPQYIGNKSLPAPLNTSRSGQLALAALNQLRYANVERQKNATFSANDFVAVMHSHSKASDLLSGMMRPGEVIRIRDEQQINCIEDRSTGIVFNYTDTLEIPIIRNDPSEGLFIEPMMAMLKKHPKATAVIMQKHGLFVWGQTSWQQTKQMFECYEYLLEGEYQKRQLRALGLLAAAEEIRSKKTPEHIGD